MEVALCDRDRAMEPGQRLGKAALARQTIADLMQAAAEARRVHAAVEVALSRPRPRDGTRAAPRQSGLGSTNKSRPYEGFCRGSRVHAAVEVALFRARDRALEPGQRLGKAAFA